MELRQAGAVWYARSQYEEKDTLKAAGFWFHGYPCTKNGCQACKNGVPSKVWWTPKAEIARKLAKAVSPEVLRSIEEAQKLKTEILAASRATQADIDVPAPVGMEYMPFQLAGIAFALGRKNTLIADEMGLGKTIQAIGVVNATNAKKILVICPASLRLNWEREMNKWMVGPLSVGVVNGGDDWKSTDVVIINYDVLGKYDTELRAVEWGVMVVDECHYLKNGKTQRSKQVLGSFKDKVAPIPAKRKLFLTGTPILNRPIELWPLLHSLDPSTWKSWVYYVQRYCAGYQGQWGWVVDGASHLEELQNTMRSTIMIRRLKSDVLSELPEKRRQILVLPANGAQAVVEEESDAYARHEDRLNDLRARVELAKAEEDATAYENAVAQLTLGAKSAFDEISKLRHATALAKVPYVVEHIQNVTGKVVVFAHHHDVIAQIASGLRDGVVVMTGETSMGDRQAAVDRFQTDPNCRVFVGSITAAGFGITLTAASLVIFAELDWVPGNITQAEDRLHRIGQKNAVTVQHIVLDGSLDAKMAQILVAKQDIIDRALDQESEMPVVPAGEDFPRITKKEIAEESLSLTPEEIHAVHAALRIVAGMCDGAHQRDGAGFNKVDAYIGRALALKDGLTARQAVLGRRLVLKYHRQVPKEIMAVLDR